jgi:hypothetical protein
VRRRQYYRTEKAGPLILPIMNSRQWRKLAHSARKLSARMKNATTSESHIPGIKPGKRAVDKKPAISPKRTFASKAITFFGYLLALLGALSAINSFRYDVSIDPYVSLNPQDPLASRFVLTNEGPYRIHDVEYQCEFPNLNIPNANPDVYQIGVEGVISLPKTELKPRGKITLRCQSPYQMIDGSFLQIRVSYRPSFWPRRTEGGNAFLLRIDNQDHAVWLPIGSLKTIEEFRTFIVQPK